MTVDCGHCVQIDIYESASELLLYLLLFSDLRASRTTACMAGRRLPGRGYRPTDDFRSGRATHLRGRPVQNQQFGRDLHTSAAADILLASVGGGGGANDPIQQMMAASFEADRARMDRQLCAVQMAAESQRMEKELYRAAKARTDGTNLVEAAQA